MFKFVEDDLDQFAYLANLSFGIGLIAAINFIYWIREKELVVKSKAIFDRKFDILGESPD